MIELIIGMIIGLAAGAGVGYCVSQLLNSPPGGMNGGYF